MYRTKSWWLQLSREFRGAHTMAPVRRFCSIFKIAKGNGVRILKNLSYFPTLFLFVITGKNFNRQSRIYIHIYVMTCIHANLIIKPIAVTTNKLQHIPNHLLIDSLFRLKIKDRPMVHMIGPLWWESPSDRCFPSQRANKAESVFMPCRHNANGTHHQGYIIDSTHRWLDQVETCCNVDVSINILMERHTEFNRYTWLWNMDVNLTVNQHLGPNPSYQIKKTQSWFQTRLVPSPMISFVHSLINPLRPADALQYSWTPPICSGNDVFLAPNHYPNQWWHNVSWTIRGNGEIGIKHYVSVGLR